MSTKGKAPKKRLDIVLVERGLADSRAKAQAIILAGQVRVDGEKSEKAGSAVPLDASVEIVGEFLPYVSRAGRKLEGALADTGVRPAGKICLDVGSSTGGFTDCLLQQGARRVYAVDVTTRQMDWRLRQDNRVRLVERNARNLVPEDIGETVDLVTVDVSFISVAKVLPALFPVARPGADFLILVKPQFELERKNVGQGGIVREPELHSRAIERVKAAAASAGLALFDPCVFPSRVTGAEGNQEFFLHARRPPVD